MAKHSSLNSCWILMTSDFQTVAHTLTMLEKYNVNTLWINVQPENANNCNNNNTVKERSATCGSSNNNTLNADTTKKMPAVEVASSLQDAETSGVGNPSNVYKMHTCVLPPPKDTVFYIGGVNGAHLVEPVLLSLGWKKTTDRMVDDIKMRWVDVAQVVDYQVFKEGDQLINRIPNCYLLTNKLGLLNSLESYERVMNVMRRSRDLTLFVSDILPETYRVDDLVDRRAFFGRFKEGDIWICKPVGMNQGKGIYLVRNLEEFKKSLDEREDKLKQKTGSRHMDRIIQRYLTNPLLLEGRKFDIRCYMLIACTSPYLVLFHRGYIRRSLFKYDSGDRNLLTHLTNQYIQKRDPSYAVLKEDTVWNMEKFNNYFNEHIAPSRNLAPDWVYTTLTPRMKHIMLHCFKTVRHKLHVKLGFFDLYGLDFILDDNLQVWLLEINSNPNLATNCVVLKDTLPSMVRDGIHIVLECFEKAKRGKALLPLQHPGLFQTLYYSPPRKDDSRSPSPLSRPAATRWPSSTPLVVPPSTALTLPGDALTDHHQQQQQVTVSGTQPQHWSRSPINRHNLMEKEEVQSMFVVKSVVKAASDGQKSTISDRATPASLSQGQGLGQSASDNLPQRQALALPSSSLSHNRPLWTSFPFPLSICNNSASHLSVSGRNFSRASNISQMATAQQLQDVATSKSPLAPMSANLPPSSVTVFKPSLAAELFPKLLPAESTSSTNFVTKSPVNIQRLQVNLPSSLAAAAATVADKPAGELPTITAQTRGHPASIATIIPSTRQLTPYLAHSSQSQKLSNNLTSSPGRHHPSSLSGSDTVPQHQHIPASSLHNQTPVPSSSSSTTRSSHRYECVPSRWSSPNHGTETKTTTPVTSRHETRPSAPSYLSRGPARGGLHLITTTTNSASSLTETNAAASPTVVEQKHTQAQLPENPVIRMLKQMSSNAAAACRRDNTSGDTQL